MYLVKDVYELISNFKDIVESPSFFDK